MRKFSLRDALLFPSQLINLQLRDTSFPLLEVHFVNMRAFTTTTAALAVFSLIQFCPAPPAVIASIAGGILGGAVSGGISAGTHNRRDLPPGVSQQSVNQCIQQINSQGTPVKVYSTGTDCKSAPTQILTEQT